MVETTASSIFFFLIGSLIAQALLTLHTAWAFRAKMPQLLNDDECPRAEVILCMRGSDPFLPQCLDAVLAQDYPAYHLSILVDHESDPVLPTVRSRLAQPGGERAKVSFLKRIPERCSLKCAALVQAVGELPAEVKVVALLDADVVTHKSWLRELATALVPEKVGVATGNRWYQPLRPSLGALVRYGWNAAAIVQMYWYRIPWGGTLALKREAIDEADLPAKWSQALCEDTMLLSAMQGCGRTVAFVPSLMMVNRENCDLTGFFHWVRRQLLVARLYHPAWALVVGHGLGTAVSIVVTICLLIAALLSGQSPAAIGWLAGGLAAYFAGLLLLLVVLESSVRRVIARRNEPTRWLSIGTILKIIASVPVTQTLYPGALTSAMFLRRVAWRGIEYQLAGGWNIRLLRYRPYRDTVPPADAESSL